jgi:hypothetical protein
MVQFSPGAQHFIIGRVHMASLDTGNPGTGPGLTFGEMFDTAIPMLTDADFNAWLKKSDSIRAVLVEADVKTALGTTTTRYLSSRGFTTDSTAWPASINYSARVTGGIKFTRSLSLDGNVSLSFGDIELINTDGALDEWLDDYWVNRQVVVLVGDPRWHRANFRPLYTGSLTGVDTRKRDRINLKMSDTLQRLNTVVSELKLDDSSLQDDNLLPLCFGECHNITPLLVDKTVGRYMVHNGAIEQIIEVRDNGVPVAFTPNLTTGTFTLTAAPFGTITASVQGAKFVGVSGGAAAYSNKIADILYVLMTQYGSANTRLSDIDINMVGMVQFNTDNTQAVGLYLTSRENVLNVCNALASSIGARLYVQSTGLVGLVKLTLPWGGATSPVNSNDMVDHTLEIRQVVDVIASAKVGYCKNWTVQDGLTTGIVQEHAALFGEEWLTQTMTDSTVAANYKLFTDPVMGETNLIRTDEATAEANRRLSLFNVPRKLFKFTGFGHMYNYVLGQYIVLTHPRFGLGAGKVGQITSVAIDPMNPQIEFEVLI